MFSYFPKQSRKKSAETIKQKQETDSSRPTCSSIYYFNSGNLRTNELTYPQNKDEAAMAFNF